MYVKNETLSIMLCIKSSLNVYITRNFDKNKNKNKINLA